ncbi:MAG: class I SAM-dependent methyltransferase [Candidatus Neomarinimicrobiota bacterium]|jgi:ubiquinone/menaquinone biosynthesis C-methylase UbiE
MNCYDNISPESFWLIRSAHYDKLFWTKDKGYLEEIVRSSDLKKEHIVLDVGTGTGAVKDAIKNYVRHVVAIDSSDAMLKKGNWTGTSIVKWDINDALFKDGIFDRVFARMVFHHITDNLDRAILRCYDVLKEKGKICVAEGVPPLDDQDVVDWYTEMFKLKETRRTFTPEILVNYLSKNGFKNMAVHVHYMENFSIVNWVKNSGLQKRVQSEILDIHINAPKKIKEAYKMRITGNDCLITSKNVIVIGKK